MFDIIHKLLDDPTFKSDVKYTTRKFKTNDIILKQGHPHSCVYLIKKGKVHVILSAQSKKNIQVRSCIADLSKNDVFGEFGLFDDLPASADVIAAADTDLIEIDIPSFRIFLESKPAIGYQVFLAMLKNLVTRLQHADKSIVSLYTWGIKAPDLDEHH